MAWTRSSRLDSILISPRPYYHTSVAPSKKDSEKQGLDCSLDCVKVGALQVRVSVNVVLVRTRVRIIELKAGKKKKKRKENKKLSVNVAITCFFFFLIFNKPLGLTGVWMDLVVAVFKLGFFCLQKFFQEIIGFLFSRQFFSWRECQEDSPLNKWPQAWLSWFLL